MQLHNARLCLDCNEIHDVSECPICGSEALAFLTRWVPAAERRSLPRPMTSPDADVYRELLDGRSTSNPRPYRLLKRGAFGVGVIAAAGWLWSELRKGKTG